MMNPAAMMKLMNAKNKFTGQTIPKICSVFKGSFFKRNRRRNGD